MSCLVSSDGTTIPANYVIKDTVYITEEAKLPGYSINQEHWDQSKAFEEKCAALAKKAIRGEATYPNFCKEMVEAKERKDYQALIMLQRQFDFAHAAIFGYVPFNPKTLVEDTARDYFMDVFQTAGKFNVMEV